MFLVQLVIYVMFKVMTKLKFSFIVFLLLNFFTVSHAEIINSIKINGNERISKETIIVLGNISTGKDLNSNDLNNIIKNLYETNFFKNINIDIQNNVLEINIIENPVIQEVIFNGIKKKSHEEILYNSVNLKNKNSFVEFYAKRDLEIISNILQQSGYYFVNVESKIIENNNNTINLVYDITLGNKAIIKEIKFTGEKVFKERKLRDIIVSESAKFWKFLTRNKYFDKSRIELDKRLLKNYYLNKGYYNVSINSTSASFLKENEFVLTYNIDAGIKYYFNKINLILPDDFDPNDFESVNEKAKSFEKKKYSLRSIDKLLDEIDKNVLTSQFKFINAKYKETIVDNNKINLDIYFDESKEYYVNRINILGNNITREEVIRAKIIVDEGDPFNELLFNKGINNIKSLNFFSDVKHEVKNAADPKKKDIDIIVEEKPTGEISAGAGVGTTRFRT